MVLRCFGWIGEVNEWRNGVDPKRSKENTTPIYPRATASGVVRDPQKDKGYGHPFFGATESPRRSFVHSLPTKFQPKLLGAGSVVEFFDPLLVPVVVVTLTGLGHGESTNRDEILESVSD